MQTTSPQILLLGVGNLLYGDEGVGVHAARFFEEHYEFSENVTLLEGGTMGQWLMPYLTECEHVIVMDTVCAGEKPGSIYRLEDGALRKSLGFSDSQHQVDLEDILIMCDLIGKKPIVIVIGMEPQDMLTLSTELTPTIQGKMEKFIHHIVEEVHATGGIARRKEIGNF